MARFLFTMLLSDDLGLPTRLVPIARVLADRGHHVRVFNPLPAPAKLIEDAGLKNVPMPPRELPDAGSDLGGVGQAWDVEELFGALFPREDFIREATALHVDLVRDFAPDVVVDSFSLFGCMAARALKIPLATVLQGNFHPASDGFLGWKGPRPQGLASCASAVNKVLAEYGVAPVARAGELLSGDLSLLVGTPETDPVAANANVTYVGPIVWQRGKATLPDWLAALDRAKPVVWAYSGNPRYANAPTPVDSIVVIQAAIAALAGAPVNVVLTTGYQEVPAEIGALPENFHHAVYLPGRAMAERSDLMIHHGGHSSVMMGLSTGTPAVIVPTMSERQSNARHMVALGAGEMAMPSATPDGEKQINAAEFSAAVDRVLREPRYRASARRVAESMRAYGGAAQAADLIESFARVR